MSAPIRTVLFDLDGTLLDSVGLILASYRHMMRTHHGHAPPDEIFRRGIGTPLRAQIAELARSEAELEPMLETYRTHCIDNHDALAGPFPGAVETVRALHGRVQLAIVSSKRRFGVLRGLRLMGIEDAFEIIVGADDVTEHKPHPLPVLQAMAQLGAEPASSIYVGDSTHDMASGRAAGVRTAAALWGPFEREALARHEPTWWLDAPGDVLALIGAQRLRV